MKLNTEQTKFLKRLQGAKDEYDKAVQEADWYAKAAKARAKNVLSAVVNEALEVGIPARQVAIKGLGYADVGSLKQFQNPVAVDIPANLAVPPTPEPVKRERVGDVQVESTDDDDFSYMVTDSFGDRFEISIAFGGKDRPDNGFAEDVEGREDSEEIKAALEKARGKTIIWD